MRQPPILLCDKLCELFFVGVAVKLVVDVAEALVGYVRVDLGGGNVAVAQEFLDAAKVNSLV